MKRLRALIFVIAASAVASAHVGSPNVVFDGDAGPYAVRVIVRPPTVVPGLADVIVRLDATDVQHVRIQPVFWKAGRVGAPRGDEVERVAGQDNVYTGQVWLMSRGSYSVYVTVSGAKGEGTAIVPVTAFATARLGISPALKVILVILGGLLIAGLITIVRAAAGESLLAPGETLDPRTRRRANITGLVVTPILALLLFGGAKWWNSVDADYQRTMYRPPAAFIETRTDSGHRRLILRAQDTAQFRAIFAPVVPDHGKMMHLFLVSEGTHAVFAHLHPVQVSPLHFETEVPWLPAGRYRAFGDMALENGLSLTVTNGFSLPAGNDQATPTDTDDSWSNNAVVPVIATGATTNIGDGLTLSWSGKSPIVANVPTDLRFDVKNAAGAIVDLNPYMGMAAHAVILRSDDSVFIHLHPMGTVPAVSQQVFAARDRGDTTARGGIRDGAIGADMSASMRMTGALSFPYEFPTPGHYRIWVQCKPGGRVLTGAFDVDVR